MKRVLAALFSLSLIVCVSTFDCALVSDAHAGVLLRRQGQIRSRLSRRPRMQINQRYLTSSQVISKTNPKLGSKGSADASRQVTAQQNATEEYYKKYNKWQGKQLKIAKREIQREKKAQHDRRLEAKKARENQFKKARRAESIKEAPLNPWFGSKKAKETGVIDLQRDGSKTKDPSRRVPLLKQIWRAIFG